MSSNQECAKIAIPKKVKHNSLQWTPSQCNNPNVHISLFDFRIFEPERSHVWSGNVRCHGSLVFHSGTFKQPNQWIQIVPQKIWHKKYGTTFKCPILTLKRNLPVSKGQSRNITGSNGPSSRATYIYIYP